MATPPKGTDLDINVESPGIDTTIAAEAAVKAVKSGRAKDVDIAAQIIAENAGEMHGEEWTVHDDKQLMRKIDWRLVPIVSSLRYP